MAKQNRPTALTKTALNRAYLGRQRLLHPHTGDVLDLVEHLVGLQAQAPAAPYVGMWSRMASFDPQALSRLLSDRAAVRLILMRSTVHLVSADDCRWIRPTLEPCLDRTVGPAVWRRLGDVDRDELARYGRKVLEQEPRTAKQLGELMRERWPGVDLVLIGRALRAVLPLVQVPPRGLWGRSGQPTYAPAESWLAGPMDDRPDPNRLIRRYLTAFGPATVRDMQVWSGLNGLQEVVDPADDLVRYTGPDGAELWDVPDGEFPDEQTPAPVRYLAEYDNAVLSHHDRSRIMARPEHLGRIVRNAVVPGTVLVDGQVRGTWRVEKERGRATLVVQPFAPLRAACRDELVAEGARLLSFLVEQAQRDVRLLDPAEA
jgi:hypothetical protein